jgi:hypothetical protein
MNPEIPHLMILGECAIYPPYPIGLVGGKRLKQQLPPLTIHRRKESEGIALLIHRGEIKRIVRVHKLYEQLLDLYLLLQIYCDIGRVVNTKVSTFTIVIGVAITL